MIRSRLKPLHEIVLGPDFVPGPGFDRDVYEIRAIALLESIRPRAAYAIVLRHGMNGDYPMSFAEIGRAIGRFDNPKQKISVENSRRLVLMGYLYLRSFRYRTRCLFTINKPMEYIDATGVAKSILSASQRSYIKGKTEGAAYIKNLVGKIFLERVAIDKNRSFQWMKSLEWLQNEIYERESSS